MNVMSRRRPTSERNELIIADHIDRHQGYPELSRRYGITVSRVAQICGEAKVARGLMTPKAMGQGRPTGSISEKDPFDNSNDEDFCALVMAQGGLPRSDIAIDFNTGKEHTVYIGPDRRMWKYIPRTTEYMEALRAELSAKRERKPA